MGFAEPPVQVGGAALFAFGFSLFSIAIETKQWHIYLIYKYLQ
jgi:hypothetical protein